MKLSLNLQDEDHSTLNPRLKAKLPISIFNQPFTSIFTTATHSFSDLSFALSTNFSSGPSLKFAYSPSAAATTTPFSPFSLCLKSGLGLFGSPHNSPLVFSAHFSLSSTSPNVIVPTFSLNFKPQLGHFSLHKRTMPSSNPDPDSISGTHLVVGSQTESTSSSNSDFANGFAPDGPLGWQEVKLEPFVGKEKQGSANAIPTDVDGVYAHNRGMGFLTDRQLVLVDRKKGGICRGLAVKARTELPLSKRVKVNLRWVLNLPGDFGTKMPYLTVNKIGFERIEEVKEVKEKSIANNGGDVELLKGMCFWMRRDLEIIEKENRDMKQCLEDMRSGVLMRNSRGAITAGGKNVVPASSDRLGEFEQWRSKQNGEGNWQMELKRPANPVSDLESELQRAIKAAAS